MTTAMLAAITLPDRRETHPGVRQSEIEVVS